jgi:hypothetical protein
MATLDRQFFRKVAKTRKRLEFTATDAILPAVDDQPEIRVPLPNRRELTMEEREALVLARFEQVRELDEKIEDERKKLADAIRQHKNGTGSVSAVVLLNESVGGMLTQRSLLARPDTWIETVEGLNFKDIFLRARDVRKLGWDLYQLKRRVEPISSLYVDVLGASDSVAPAGESVAAGAAPAPASVASAPAASVASAPAASVAQAPKQTAATAAIVGKRVLKLKKATPAAP